MAGNIYVSTPINELLARLLLLIGETVDAANDVLVQKRSFSELATYVGKIKPVLLEIKNKNTQNISEPMKAALDTLEALLREAQRRMKSCSSGSRLQILLKCRGLSKQLQDMNQQIASCLDLFTAASLDLSLGTRETTVSLCETMRNAQFTAAVETEEISTRLEEAFCQENINRQNVIRLLIEIAKVTETQMDASFVTCELEQIKKEKEEFENQKQLIEANDLQQVIAFLYRSEMVAPSHPGSPTSDSHATNEDIHDEDRPSKFLCPITGKLMDDPVQIASGHTFERKEIQKWFDQGNKVCFLTGEPLENFSLQPNLSIRELIEEWKERRLHDKLNNAATKVRSNNKNQVEEGLVELCDHLSMAVSLLDEKDLILRLVNLLETADEGIIILKAMECLSTLAKKTQGNQALIEQALIADSGGANRIVKFLAEDDHEVKAQVLTLLLELSRNSHLCEMIGMSIDCIPQLVALHKSENGQIADKAREVLENMSYIDANLKQMAQANYFKPFQRQLANGSLETKVRLVSALAVTVLTDYSKKTLAQEGIIPALVQMLSESTTESKLLALHVLEILSTLPGNREDLLDAQMVETLFDLLILRQDIDMKNCKEMAANILANLAMPPKNAELKIHTKLKYLKKDTTVRNMMLLLGEAGPSLKVSLLRILLGLGTVKKAGKVRDRMINGGALQWLLALCTNSNPTIKLLALRLLHSLTADGNGNRLEGKLGESHVKAFVMILLGSNDEEKVAVAGILGNLPVSESDVTRMFLKGDALPAIVGLLSKHDMLSSSIMRENIELVESALGALLPFTSLSNVELSTLAELDVISLLVRILSSGTPLAKQKAGMVLGKLSERTMQLSRPVAKTSARNLCCWWESISDEGCPVHKMACSAKDSFCLVKANAIVPLVRTLQEREYGADEVALNALDTLLLDGALENAVKVIETSGILAIVRLLVEGSTGVKERMLPVLLKLSKLPQCHTFFGKPEQNNLIQLMQKSSTANKKIAAKILSNLGVIPDQTSFF